jgi:glutamine amidotransferase-like uncharacterized protein
VTAVRQGRAARKDGGTVLEPYRRAFTGALPRVAVFAGAGASHSWTWFADLLEHLGLFDTSFIDERSILEGGLAGFDMLLVGGGDTYAMAESLGPAGAREMESFVRDGGFYLGSCAGAYLVLSDVDLEPFTPFALVEGGMLNVMSCPPEPRCLAHKYLAPYGDQWVFHPVYGEVRLGPAEAGRTLSCFEEGRLVDSAMFGGPIIRGGRDEEVVARFAELSDHAAYPWPRAEVGALMSGYPAVVLARVGRGTAVASGPHLEHPHYPTGNALAAELMSRHWEQRATAGLDAIEDMPRPGIARSELRTREGSCAREGTGTTSLLRDIKREVSNARIVAFGLEKMPVTWRIGVKVWEPEKIRMFLECAWNRLPYLEARDLPADCAGELRRLGYGYSDVTGLTRALKLKVESGEQSQAEAQELLLLLKALTSGFLAMYFSAKFSEGERPGP